VILQVLTESSGLKYMETRKRAQTALVSSLQRELTLKQQETSSATVDITQVPYFDTEITGFEFTSKLLLSTKRLPNTNLPIIII
jgi:hypothetical protein